MGFGIFGSMFDFNRDGEMDVFERAAEFGFFHEVVLADEAKEELTPDAFDSTDYDDEY